MNIAIRENRIYLDKLSEGSFQIYQNRTDVEKEIIINLIIECEKSIKNK